MIDMNDVGSTDIAKLENVTVSSIKNDFIKNCYKNDYFL